MRLFSCFLIAACVAAPQTDASESGLPAGTRVTVRMADYVNTEHQPVGFTFRGIVDGNVSAAGKIIIPDKSRVLMRLVADSGPAGGLTVELWAVKFGDEWSEFRAAGGEKNGLFTTLRSVDDRRAPAAEARPLVSRGRALYVPSNSMLQFEIRQPVRLLNVGRFRL